MNKIKFSTLECAYLISNLIPIIGAILVFAAIPDFDENAFNTIGSAMVIVGTILSVALGWLLLIESKREISENNRVAREAQQSAAIANWRAENLKRNLAWRNLNKDQIDIFIEALEELPRESRTPVTIQFMSNDTEVELFRRTLFRVISEAGFEVACEPLEGIAVGTNINLRLNRVNQAIRDAFLKADVPFTVEDYDDASESQETVITIGTQPPADAYITGVGFNSNADPQWHYSS